MLYSLKNGDFVLVENLSAGIHVPSWFFLYDRHIYEREEGIHRGDLLAFRHPLDNRLYLKRCIALPGDRIFQKGKDLYLQIEGNSQKSCRFAQKAGIETYMDHEGCWMKNPYMKFFSIAHRPEVTGPPELIDYPRTTIPEHKYFFMDDFRDNSTDSRYFGPVEYDRIYYKVFMTIRFEQALSDLAAIPWL
jgi:signal peptidase I